jgi:predicted amidophosphoribosyltransferase
MRLSDLVDLVLPVECVGCARPGARLCPTCAAPDPRLAVDAASFPVAAAARYSGGLRTALIAYKDHGRHDLAVDLAALLALAVRQIAATHSCLVPVPSRAAATRARGGDHLLRLARRLPPGAPVRPAVRFGRRVSDSTGLGSVARERNLVGAMVAAAPATPGREAVIIDDIVTSGATVRETARALSAAGWHVVGAAAIAATVWPGKVPPKVLLALNL